MILYLDGMINTATLSFMTLQHWREIKAVTIFGNSFMYTVATELPYNEPLECKFFNFQQIASYHAYHNSVKKNGAHWACYN